MKSLNVDALLTTDTVMKTVCDFLDHHEVPAIPEGMSEEQFAVVYTALLDNVSKIIRKSLDDVYSEGYSECYKDILGKAN